MVAEVPGNVAAIQPLPVKIVCQQMHLLFKTYPVAAIKTGMLHAADIVEAVAEVCAEHPRVPLVVDPIMVASSGAELLPHDAIELYREQIFPLATLVTPNLDEVRALLPGWTIDTLPAIRAAGTELCELHETAFLMKGGHLSGGQAIDLLCLPGGAAYEFRAPFTSGVSTHGTGCTYSAAITAGLAQGLDLRAAIAQAKRYITAAIRESFAWDHHPREIEALNHWTDPSTNLP